jgi:hypothetical protein
LSLARIFGVLEISRREHFASTSPSWKKHYRVIKSLVKRAARVLLYSVPFTFAFLSFCKALSNSKRRFAVQLNALPFEKYPHSKSLAVLSSPTPSLDPKTPKCFHIVQMVSSKAWMSYSVVWLYFGT